MNACFRLYIFIQFQQLFSVYIDICCISIFIFFMHRISIIIIILNQLTQFDYNMKTKKELKLSSQFASFFKSSNKLQLNSKSTLNLQNSNHSNRSNEKSIGIKQKNLGKDQSEQKLLLSTFSKYKDKDKDKASIAKKGRDNNQSNIENKDLNLMPSRDSSLVKTGTDSKSYRSIKNVDLESKSNRAQSKKVADFQNKTLTKQRSHHSENLSLLENKMKKEKNDIEKKLYTFCDKSHPDLKNSSGLKVKKVLQTEEDQNLFHGNYFQSQENLICNGTVVVRQEQLKRFTHKFAREKIQTEETIGRLTEELNKLQIKSEQYEIEKLDFLECLQYKQSQIVDIKTKLSHAEIKAEIQKDQFMKWKFSVEQQIKQLNMRNKYLQDMLRIRDQKISQLLILCDQTQCQLNKQEIQIQNSRFGNNFCLPLANIHHALSINTSSSNESPPKISEQLLQQLQYLRRQCLKKDNETNQSLMYMKIENDYICKQLVLQKEVNATLKQEVDQLKSKIYEQEDSFLRRNIPQTNRQVFGCSHENQIQSLKSQVSKSMIRILHLEEKKEILQRSLKVSSEMIIKLKQQNERLKRKQASLNNYHEIEGKGELSFTQKQVQSIIFKMMKQQLQMQDKAQNQLYSSIQSKRKVTMKNQILQKRYEEGYQSVKRSGRENRNSKTEHSDENTYNDFHSQVGYYHENGKNTSNWVNSQGQSSLKNLSAYKKQLF